MKLHHLLQKCSFFLIKLAAFLASGAARVKLHETTNDELWMSLSEA
jgi:hypothetical protein